ncbi:MAG: hypothetical protein JO063_09050 [Pseudonocardiales bacterium]|nr:hypothetical protein [Pseudonocardiales bacterium]MBV9032391.1 hypothetical protein [Pseudonocardiales bacterium]MBW0010247.1 hypothetical protein [Pseudonocardiales bacterium]
MNTTEGRPWHSARRSGPADWASRSGGSATTLRFDQHEMAAFIAGAKNGDFDHLLE